MGIEYKLHKEAIDIFRGDRGLEILDAMDDLVRVVNVKGTVVYANSKMISFCGIDPVGMSCTDPTNALVPGMISTSTFMTRSTIMSEMYLRGHVFSVKSSPLFSEDGKEEVIAAIEVFRDITIQNNVTAALFEANRKMTEDISLAKTIQAQMLPRITNFGDVAFDYRYIPSGQLSGDMFDLIPIDCDRMAVYIADVVGHGVSASILTMFVRQTMRSILDDGTVYRPAEVLAVMRNRFEELGLDVSQYFSLFYALVDTEDRTMTFANAGHNCAPLLLHDGESEFLECSGRLICTAFKPTPYKEHVIPLKEGSRVLFYTDGVVETQNREGAQYGRDSLARIAETAEGSLLDKIVGDTEAYRWGEQRDDVALLLMEVKIQ